MTRVVALLRAVNVSGTKAVAMPELCKLLTGLGYTGVKSLLASGNVVFGCTGRAGTALEAKLEAAVAETLGLRTEIFVRDVREWDAVVAQNPFQAAARDDPGRFVMVTLKSAPAAAEVAALRAAIVGRETLAVTGRHAYIVYPDGQGTSNLTNAVIARKLRTPGTARNWNTVLKIAAALAA